MKVMLNERWRDRLRECPESGMGYHLVDITLHSGVHANHVVVIDSREADWPAEKGAIAAEDIKAMELSQQSI